MHAMRNRHSTTAATLLTTAALLTACSTGDSAPLDEAAAVMCEDFVKQRLKSPGSAKFPGTLDADYAKTTTLSDTKPWKYKVTGHVDSDNSFGATVRTNYVCTVSTKDNDTWNLDDIQTAER